ncbi:endonuclease V [Candidatus Thorarchaeota archaeon]|nr:MAG: endonuclease V [Candidatus Thorarchaeota archaeon]
MKDALRSEQNRLREAVIKTDCAIENSHQVTGVDVAYHDQLAFGAAVTIDIHENAVLRKTQIQTSGVEEYVPGQFYMREGPVLKQLLADHRPAGPVLVDANGILHPRRFGLASHIGVVLDIVTIGVAKSLLLGQVQERDTDTARITDKGEVMGMALWLEERETPIYVSIGHRVSLPTAVAIVRASSWSGYPEPLRLADRLSKEQKRRFLEDGGGADPVH